jgi:hypothetical protein
VPGADGRLFVLLSKYAVQHRLDTGELASSGDIGAVWLVAGERDRPISRFVEQICDSAHG